MKKVNLKILSELSDHKILVTAFVENVMNVNILLHKKVTSFDHIMNQHEPTDVFQHYGMSWNIKHFKYVKRNCRYAQDRYHFKKWESFVDGQV